MSPEDVLAFLNAAASRATVRRILDRTVGALVETCGNASVSIDDSDILARMIEVC